MTITASQVKELREKTGVGMMDCKKALNESGGDFEKAVKYLREKGLAAAAKKADRTQNEGRVFTVVSADKSSGVVLEANCETDFVGGNDEFLNFGNTIATAVLNNDAVNTEADLDSLSIDGKAFSDYVSAAVLKLGENISVKQFAKRSGSGQIEHYTHINGKIGVLLSLTGEMDSEVAKGIAMHIAAVNPLYLKQDQIPAEEVEKEREIVRNQVLQEGKPENIVDKIVDGKLSKYFKDICLLNQNYVKDPEKTIQSLLPAGVEINEYIRYSLV